MAAEDCAGSAIASICGALDGTEISLSPCPNQPAHMVLLRHDVAGVRIELLAPVCASHEVLIGTTKDFQRSYKIRQPADTQT